MDFEAAAHRAISEEFSNILRKGCNFHFGQCLWRKIQELGLTTVSNFKIGIKSYKFTLKKFHYKKHSSPKKIDLNND